MRTTLFTMAVLSLVLAGAALFAQTPPPKEQPSANQPAPTEPQGPPMMKLEPQKAPPAGSQRPTGKTPPADVTRPGHWDFSIKRLDEQLQLTESQKTKIKAVWEGEMKQSQSIYRDTTLTSQKKRESLQSISKKSQEEIRKLLTADQQKKYDVFLATPAKPAVSPKPAPTPTPAPAPAPAATSGTAAAAGDKPASK